MVSLQNKSEIKNALDKNTNIRSLLFSRGFLLTNNTYIDESKYPFYNLWETVDVFEYRFFVHPDQKIFISKNDKYCMALIGHAYNPFSDNEYTEDCLLNNAIHLYDDDKKAFIEYFNKWTGNFVLFIFDGNTLIIYGDTAGMYTIFYGECNNKFYCSSHTALIGDICNLKFDAYVEKLINYKFYSLFGKTLPGDITPYVNFKRLIPNHNVVYENNNFTISRFYPTESNSLVDFPYKDILKKSSEILSSSMSIIYKKWKRPAVSLTGGCDSKTTLSCTNGFYDRYNYFSYISSDAEEVDAVAAAKISNLLKINHQIYNISDNDNDFDNVFIIKQIMEHNSGDIGKNNANDIRKRIFFINNNDFDVEIKSWVSEVARAYYHKRFLKKNFPKKLTPRYATALYKVFVTERKLIRETDKIFEQFINKYYSDGSFDKIPWYDLFFWEFRMSSWNGLVITGEHQISYDITIPYNNRNLLQLMLSTPVEYRVQDKIHKDIIAMKNPDISNSNISVVNVKHTKNRARIERLYLSIFSKFRF